MAFSVYQGNIFGHPDYYLSSFVSTRIVLSGFGHTFRFVPLQIECLFN